MTSRLIKILAVLAVISMVAGCKLAVMVTEGGTVQYSGGECAQGAVCTIPITNPNFSQTYTAVAKRGYQFVRWNTGGGFLCANSTSPTCTVALTGDALSETIVGTFTTGYIMPVFKDVGIDLDGDGLRNEVDEDDDGDGYLDVDDACPLNPNLACDLEAITVNGREWAQPGLFRGVTWDAINAICPSGVCTGTLAGSYLSCDGIVECVTKEWAYNLTGWTWAGESELTALINFYKDAAAAFDCASYERVVADGFRPNLTAYGPMVVGWVASDIPYNQSFFLSGVDGCMAGVYHFNYVDGNDVSIWLYRNQ